jgi:hypothetical protein
MRCTLIWMVVWQTYQLSYILASYGWTSLAEVQVP